MEELRPASAGGGGCLSVAVGGFRGDDIPRLVEEFGHGVERVRCVWVFTLFPSK